MRTGETHCDSVTPYLHLIMTPTNIIFSKKTKEQNKRVEVALGEAVTSEQARNAGKTLHMHINRLKKRANKRSYLCYQVIIFIDL